jgi:transposase InsO family protein
VSIPLSNSETYLEVDLRGVKLQCLIDSGCERSCIPRRIVPRAILKPTTLTLTAANNSDIPVLGSIRLKFKVDNMPLYADFLVSEHIDEPILSYEWLVENQCQWDFTNAILSIKGKSVKLKSRPSRANIRRIFVRNTIVVPAEVQTNVPVRMPLCNLRSPVCDWITDAKEVRPGLFAARTLLADDDTFAAIRFINLSGREHKFDKGHYLGFAKSGVGCLVRDAIGVSEAIDNAGLLNGVGRGSLSVLLSNEAATDDSYILTSQSACSAVNLNAINLVTVGFDPSFPPPPVIRESRPETLYDDVIDVARCQDLSVEPLVETMPLGGETLNYSRVRKVSPRVDVSQVRDSDDNRSNSLNDPVALSDYMHLFEGEFSYLKPIVDSLPLELSDEQRKVTCELLLRNADVFSKHEYDIGCTNLITHRIITDPSLPPICQSLRSHARVHLDMIDREVERMVKADILEPAASPYSSNVVVVTKADGSSSRITLDFRLLNQRTYMDKFPLPKINDCLDSLSDQSFFCTLDMSNSFYQIPLDERDRDKTAFLTRKGQWRFKRMPQGGAGSPAQFCRLMSLVLKGINGISCMSFIDDCIIFGKTFEQTCENLEVVLNRFRIANLKLKASKCHLFNRRIEFLGFTVSQAGVEVSLSKTACVREMTFPSTITALRSAIGLFSYYRSFCKDFSRIAEPLIECMRKDVPLIRTPERVHAFETLKRMICEAPCLALPRDVDSESEFVVDCDASLFGCSAILQQWQDGQLKVIEYASRTFNSAERSYCVTRREMAALIFGLKQFKRYLLGYHFTVRVDHQALTYYKRTVEPIGQQARYLDFIAQFNFDTVFRPGSSHINADVLSRLRPCERDSGEPCRQCNRRINGKHGPEEGGCLRQIRTREQRRREKAELDASQQANAPPVSPAVPLVRSGRPDHVIMTSPRGTYRPNERVTKPVGLFAKTAPHAASLGVSTWTPEYLASEQLNDPDIGPAFHWLSDGLPDWNEMKCKGSALRSLWRQWESIIIQNGVLYRIFYNIDGTTKLLQLILPRSLKLIFLEMVHCDAAAHLKFAKCLEHVRTRAWWASFRTDLRNFINACGKCSSYHRGPAPKRGKLQKNLVGDVATRWAIDLSGPYPMSNGYQYLFTAMDVFSKYLIAVPIRNKLASTVAKVIVDRIIQPWYIPVEILSDNGGEFVNQLSDDIYDILGMSHLRITAYNSKANGIIERSHASIHSMLAKLVKETQTDWSQYVGYVVSCYNATAHSITNLSPHYVMTGQMPRWNIDFLLGVQTGQFDNVHEYALQNAERLATAHDLVRQHLQKSAEHTSTWYNKKVRESTFYVGDEVRIFCPRRYKGRSPKLQSTFKDVGTVVKRLNAVTYIIHCKSWKTDRIIHVDKLKLVERFSP